MAEKWREMTSIEDYEFDPDGRFDSSLTKDEWDEIFTELYQRAETTEEYLDNDWIDPVSTRNAYTYRVKKNGEEYIVLKYYDGMYALYEIEDEADLRESASKTAQVIAKLDEGVSVRQAILESVQVKNKVFEDVAGMDQASNDELIAKLDKWTGGSGKNGWEYESKKNSNNVYVINVKKNPIAKFDGPVVLDVNDNVLNGELYYKPTDEYLAASGPVQFAGLKSIIRDIESQVEMATDTMETEPSQDIYGY